MKNYKKTYEDTYSAERSIKRCDINKVSTDIDLTVNDYKEKIRKTILSFQKEVFNHLVKISWLNRRFVYDGKPRINKCSNGFYLDRAFGVFMRNYVGVENRMIGKNNLYTKIETYFDDFFEDFDARNPFEEEMEFPYKHITLEYLIVVYQMSERLELLGYAEKEKMPYVKFLDYVINYICNFNEEHNDYQYIIKVSNMFMPYVKKYEGAKIKTSDIH